MTEIIPRVWNERANNGRPVRTTASLLACSADGTSIFPNAAPQQVKSKSGESEKERDMASPVSPSHIPRAVVVWGSAFGVLNSHAPPSGLSRRDSAKHYLLCLISCLALYRSSPNSESIRSFRGSGVREYHEEGDKTVRTVNTV